MRSWVQLQPLGLFSILTVTVAQMDSRALPVTSWDGQEPTGVGTWEDPEAKLPGPLSLARVNRAGQEVGVRSSRSGLRAAQASSTRSSSQQQEGRAKILSGLSPSSYHPPLVLSSPLASEDCES